MNGIPPIMATAAAVPIGFNDFVSSTENQLVRDFNQTGAVTPYIQSPTGGIPGGSVIGFSGDQYQATAIYNQAAFNFSKVGAEVSLSIDLFFASQFHPLAPSANAVRS